MTNVKAKTKHVISNVCSDDVKEAFSDWLLHGSCQSSDHVVMSFSPSAVCFDQPPRHLGKAAKNTEIGPRVDHQFCSNLVIKELGNTTSIFGEVQRSNESGYLTGGSGVLRMAFKH